MLQAQAEFLRRGNGRKEQRVINYQVMPKAEIPPTPTASKENYGEWRAIARLLKLIQPSEVVAIDLDGILPSTAVTSLHGAARISGIRVSTMRVGNRMYVSRVGATGDVEAVPEQYEYACQACGRIGTGTRKMQRFCRNRDCQRERINANNRACHDRKRKAKQKNSM